MQERKTPEKILIVGPSWIGDMVMAQTLFILLKQKNPNCIIDVIAPTFTQALLARMPEINKGIELPIGHGKFNCRKRYQIGKSLRGEGYQQAIILPNSWKSALIPFFSKIPLRTGWLGEARYGLVNDARKLDKTKYPLMVQRFMALGLGKNEALDDRDIKPSLQTDPKRVQSAIDKFKLNTQEKSLALCPGAEYGPTKRWPADYFAKLAIEKLEEGWQVLIFGSEKDKPHAKKIQLSSRNKCIDLCGKTSLDEAIDLLSVVDHVVTNDSGLMHIAAALNKPLVVIYGSSSPGFTPPLTEKVKILSLELACSPCFKRTCPLDHMKCMYDLMPKQVLESLS